MYACVWVFFIFMVFSRDANASLQILWAVCDLMWFSHLITITSHCPFKGNTGSAAPSLSFTHTYRHTKCCKFIKWINWRLNLWLFCQYNFFLLASGLIFCDSSSSYSLALFLSLALPARQPGKCNCHSLFVCQVLIIILWDSFTSQLLPLT